MKIINIRGSHCSGKTTAVRLFIEKNKNEVIETIVNGIKTHITLVNDGKVVVLGRYDQATCGGCDRYKGGGHVKATLQYVVKQYRPEVIIYEGIIYSITFKMATEIADLSNKMGYEWKSIYLFREYNESMEFLEKRNHGKQVNVEAIYAKYVNVNRVFKKLLANNYNVKKIDVTGKSIEYLGDIIENEIGGR
jgi:thiol-disulfide isomerase/thioredoxin